jgi:ATP-dependent DNA ligase
MTLGSIRLRSATTLATIIAKTAAGLRFNEHMEEEDGPLVFKHACKLGLEGIVSKHRGSRYHSGRSRYWVKSKNPLSPAVKREAEIDCQRWPRRARASSSR